MSPASAPPDAAIRVRALDTRCSFLVQAPAGAGKTELLVRRYLCLLAEADEPEEILAVTFTRKAAAEMQQRVVAALGGGDSAGSAPELEALAAQVRERDGQRGWQLARHPARLRISTIDALNAALARSAPLSSGASALRTISERPGRLYRLAAGETLRLLTEGGAAGAAVERLLLHLDNNPGKAEGLLAQLLARRDQWLPFIGAGLEPAAARAALEGALRRLVGAELGRVRALLPAEPLAELREVVHAAAINRGVDLGAGLDGDEVAVAGWWRAAAGLLLTDKGTWRRALDKRQGVPADQGDLKAHALRILGELREIPGLEDALAAVQALPPPAYDPAQWGALEALLTLLPFAAASLKLVFAAEGETDYPEVAAEARAALGDEVTPSEVALRLDWRLRHLLLDEFQDTSQAQYRLLLALTRGWTPGDGRTLFLVGDPMQSIYRFRQAEVRLFLDVRDHGLPGLELEFLRLTANFRSVPALVAWANDAFAGIFPPGDDPLASAIAFSPSVPTRAGGDDDGPAVSLHDSAWDDPEAEARSIVGIVRRTLERWPDETIGILVRSRAHARHAVAALTAAGIGLGANELVELGNTSLAADLLAVTRSLVHAGDRLAWLGVLRSPLGGVSLADLERIGSQLPAATLCKLADRTGEVRGLSADGRTRVLRVAAAFALGRGRLGRLPLRDVVEGVWLELGGPAFAGRELALVEMILAGIDRHAPGGDCADTHALARALRDTRGSLPAAAARVQVMTIHKAKGLQFDTVIVPGLGRRTRRDDRPALLWQEVPRAAGTDLLLAPVNATGAANDPLYELLWSLRGQQEIAETDRLLYVAVTRARQRLHLLGQREPAAGAAGVTRPPAPGRGSLLERLWPMVGSAWPREAATPAKAPSSADLSVAWLQVPLRRLPADWQRPAPPAGIVLDRDGSADARDAVAYDWASAWARQAGAVAHRCLQELAARRGGLNPETLAGLRPAIRPLLVRAGVEGGAIDRASERVLAVLEAALRDPAGRWALSAEHGEAVNEFAVTVAEGGRLRHLVIDRAFVTADGVRWIVDYKTGSHEGGDRAAFVRSEVERYAPQLRAYRAAFACLEERPTQTALYFPLLSLLEVVDPVAPRDAD